MQPKPLYVLLLGAFALLPLPAAAQIAEIGAKGGASFSTLNAEDESFDFESRNGFTGGGYVRFALTPALSLQPELMWVGKGAETSFEEFGERFDMGFEFDYVEIPVLLRYDFAAGSLSPYVYGGPAFAFEAGCTVTAGFAGTTDSADCDEEFEGETVVPERKAVDIGAMVGGGFGIPAGPGRVFLEGRYNWGVTNVFKESAEGDEAKHRSGAVLAGYSVSLGR